MSVGFAPVASAGSGRDGYSWTQLEGRGVDGREGGAREARQRSQPDMRREQMQERQRQNAQQAQQRERQLRQQAGQENLRHQSEMRERQRQQQVVQELMRRQQADQRQQQATGQRYRQLQNDLREREQRQQTYNEQFRRQQAQQREQELRRQSTERQRWQQANVERERREAGERRERDARQRSEQLARQQALLRQQQFERERYRSEPQHREARRDGHPGQARDGYQANYRHADYRRPYRPVYNDRPWYGYHGHGRYPHRRGPIVVYQNVTHVVTIPQPVYVQSVPGYYYDDYYYSGPYAGYDTVYGYGDYGYGYRRSACNSDKVGAVIGAVLGGVIGAHQDRGAGPVVGGALIGAVLGGLLGQAIDDSNRACVSDILEYVPSNQPVYWEDSGYGYQVTPLRTYEPEPGRYCREYQTVVTIGGRAEEAYGTACRQPDGSWQIVS